MTEAELVQIYRDQVGRIYAYVSRRTAGDRGLTEDIVQETWLRAVATWQKRGLPKNSSAWLYKVARNLLADHFRRRRPLRVDSNQLDIATNDVSPETPDAAKLVHWGLARLKRKQALLIEQFHFERKSIRDIAKDHGLSERAVEGRLRRARQRFKDKIEPFINEDIVQELGLSSPDVEGRSARQSTRGMEDAK